MSEDQGFVNVGQQAAVTAQLRAMQARTLAALRQQKADLEHALKVVETELLAHALPAGEPPEAP